jgi:hypothetical protein
MAWNVAPLCVAFDCLAISSEQYTHFHACEWSLKWSFAFTTGLHDTSDQVLVPLTSSRK